jgi:hypothetical protein
MVGCAGATWGSARSSEPGVTSLLLSLLKLCTATRGVVCPAPAISGKHMGGGPHEGHLQGDVRQGHVCVAAELCSSISQIFTTRA